MTIIGLSSARTQTCPPTEGEELAVEDASCLRGGRSGLARQPSWGPLGAASPRTYGRRRVMQRINKQLGD